MTSSANKVEMPLWYIVSMYLYLKDDTYMQYLYAMLAGNIFGRKEC